MQLRKNATPSRQASGVAHENTRRLSQSEWNGLWNRDGWVLVAGFAAFFAIVTLIETGVIL